MAGLYATGARLATTIGTEARISSTAVRALAELVAWLGLEAPASIESLVEPSLPALPPTPAPNGHLEERPDVRAARAPRPPPRPRASNGPGRA